jgi:trehalose 6-phosphate synthase
MTMRLFICSNSTPAVPAGPDDMLRPAAPGGLIPHVVTLLGAHGGEWFFPWDAESTTTWPSQLQGVGTNPIAVADKVRRSHYETISIETLVWLFHYLHDTVRTPAFDSRLHTAWRAYEHVNEAFADRVAQKTRYAADGMVIVNDYPLMLVPQALSRRANRARVVYAHQVPWCEPDYFGLLPAPIRDQILASLLTCDTLVFHAQRWLSAFARCCERYVAGVKIEDDRIEHSAGTTYLRAVPFPLDTPTVRALRDSESGERWADLIRRRAQGRKLLVRVDRLDLWKNHLRGITAFEELLHRRPTLANDVWFLTVLSPTRYRSTRHQEYEAACRAAVERLNTAYGTGTRPQVATLLYPERAEESRHRGLAALSLADSVLVNPTIDGFNLVAKEALLLGQGPILLSRNTGAYEYLAGAVTPLDPFDVTGTCDALEPALTGAPHHGPQTRAQQHASVLLGSSTQWLTSVLGGVPASLPASH